MSLILIAVLAVMQGILGILRAFEWFRLGIDLSQRGVRVLPLLGAVAFTRGKLVLVIALGSCWIPGAWMFSLSSPGPGI